MSPPPSQNSPGPRVFPRNIQYLVAENKLPNKFALWKTMLNLLSRNAQTCLCKAKPSDVKNKTLNSLSQVVTGSVLLWVLAAAPSSPLLLCYSLGRGGALWSLGGCEDPSEMPARQRAGAAGVAPSQLEAGPETALHTFLLAYLRRTGVLNYIPSRTFSE